MTAATPPCARELDLMGAVAPQARNALAGAWRAAHEEVEPDVLAVARRRIEAQLGLAPDGETPADGRLAAVAALADQFAFYVPHVDEGLRAPVREALGEDGLHTLVNALYVLDQTARLRIAHGRLFDEGDRPASAPPVAPTALPLREALSELHAQAMLLRRLDEETTEIVRLGAANYHDCKT
jgi:hypothetical protein